MKRFSTMGFAVIAFLAVPLQSAGAYSNVCPWYQYDFLTLAEIEELCREWGSSNPQPKPGDSYKDPGDSSGGSGSPSPDTGGCDPTVDCETP